MTNAHSIKDSLLLATTQLKAQSIEAETAKFEAQLLLQHALNVNRAWLIAHENDPLEANIHAAYRALIKRRANGEPIAYILGCREFYGLNLKVTPYTLIPRADTETLVEAALARIAALSTAPLSPTLSRWREREQTAQALHRQHQINLTHHTPRPLAGEGLGERGDIKEEQNNSLTILDLGTGTGAIALAIAKHRPNALVTAVDANQAALDIAMENAKNLNINNVKFFLSDWFSSLNDQKFDVIVSNPPYIEQNDAHLSQGDLPWEPISALVAGHDGLSDIRKIICQAPQHLSPRGWLMLEHGYNQATRVADLLKQAGFGQISHAQDLAGINRVTLGCLPS